MTKIQSRLILFTSKLLSRRNILIRNNYFRNFSRDSVKRTAVNEEHEEDRLREEDTDYNRKIIYNEVLYKQVKDHRTMLRREHAEYKKERLESLIKDEKYYTPSLALKYLTESESQTEPDKTENLSLVHFPFEIKTTYLQNHEEEKNDNLDDVNKPVHMESPNKYINECNFIRDGLEDDVVPYDVRYGTADPRILPSMVPCGGCGAHLHCADMAVPGFIPKEIFTQLKKVELRSIICQRCHFLKEYDMALGVNVSNDEYPKILRQIQDQMALAVIMIDLMDFPCSIWPNILDIIGRNRPVVIVGNKIDLFIQDNDWLVDHMKKCLRLSLEENDFEMDNIKHIALISAKSGYGVEDLITKIHMKWGTKGDIYLIGCTNVGKSTLFNLLIRSDLCKLKAVDVLQRATTSYWPGTTLNLLKFPILRPNPERLYLRQERLKELSKSMKAKQEVMQYKKNKSPGEKQFSLSESVERTYFPGVYSNYLDKQDEFAEVLKGAKPIGLDPDDDDFAGGKWCYDTPGVVHPDQILNLLTTAELVKTVPKEMILPRNFRLKPGFSLLIGGLARLDFLSGSHAWFTVFASKDLPVTITKIEDAEYVYNKLLGTDYFVVPVGNKERLKMWPALKSEIFEIVGKYEKEGAGDVVLSSAGWVTVTLRPAEYINVEAWTPEGRGLHLRQPAVVKYASQFRGGRIGGTPAYHVNLKIADNELEGMELEEVKKS